MSGQPARVVDLTAGNHQTHPANLPRRGGSLGCASGRLWQTPRVARRPSKHLRPARPLSSGHATTADKRDGAGSSAALPGRSGHQDVPLPRLLSSRSRRAPPMSSPGPRCPEPAVGIGRRGTAALAHRLLAAAPVTKSRNRTRCPVPTTERRRGPRVVFLHGLFGQGKNWTTVAKALSAHARVTLVDLPNHGRSPLDRPVLLSARWPARSPTC